MRADILGIYILYFRNHNIRGWLGRSRNQYKIQTSANGITQYFYL